MSEKFYDVMAGLCMAFGTIIKSYLFSRYSIHFENGDEIWSDENFVTYGDEYAAIALCMSQSRFVQILCGAKEV